MEKATKTDGDDEILYLDEIFDDASKPLTNEEAVSSIHSIPINLRADFSKPEVNESNLLGSRRVSKSEIDDVHYNDDNDEKPSGQPALAIGFNNRNGLLPESQLNWPNNILPSSPSIIQLPTPDMNVYQQKKTLAQGMMDLALLSANANQMRYVLQTDGRHPYFYPSLAMISMSLFLQIAVGIGLIWNSVYNVKEHEQMCKANRANNWTVIGIFLVTIFNVFISSFGVVDQPTVTS